MDCSGTECQTCDFGYVYNVNNGSCTQIIPRCKQYGNDDTCTECEDNYDLSQDQMKCNESNNCQLYTCDMNTCIKCKNGFELTD